MCVVSTTNLYSIWLAVELAPFAHVNGVTVSKAGRHARDYYGASARLGSIT